MLKLSEAMRLGAMIRPQAFNALFDIDAQASCALGAVGEAIGVLDTNSKNRFIDPSTRSAEARRTIRSWRWAKQQRIDCPACGSRWYPGYRFGKNVEGAIVHLNNDHRWTREQIADWVATIEAQQEANTVQPELQSAGGTEAR